MLVNALSFLLVLILLYLLTFLFKSIVIVCFMVAGHIGSLLKLQSSNPFPKVWGALRWAPIKCRPLYPYLSKEAANEAWPLRASGGIPLWFTSIYYTQTRSEYDEPDRPKARKVSPTIWERIQPDPSPCSSLCACVFIWLKLVMFLNFAACWCFSLALWDGAPLGQCGKVYYGCTETESGALPLEHRSADRLELPLRAQLLLQLDSAAQHCTNPPADLVYMLQTKSLSNSFRAKL